MNSIENYWNKIYKKVFFTEEFTKDKTVLDVGCGAGDLAKRLAVNAEKVVGMASGDSPEDDFDKLELPENVELIEANAEKMPFEDDSFDLVFSKDTFHHIHNIGLAFDEIKRVLKPNGLIILVEANRYNPLFYVNTTKIHKHNHFSTGYLKLLIEENGFTKFKHKLIHTRDVHIYHPVFDFLVTIYETLAENIPLINRFNTYNVFYIQNTKEEK